MSPAVKEAFCDWLASLLIGLTPLIAHALLHAFVEPSVAWEDNWSADILFVAITNSGVSVVTVFGRILKPDRIPLSSTARVLMAVTAVLFLCSGILYGAVASGHSKNTIYISIAFLIGSGLTSMYFEMALANAKSLANSKSLAKALSP